MPVEDLEVVFGVSFDDFVEGDEVLVVVCLAVVGEVRELISLFETVFVPNRVTLGLVISCITSPNTTESTTHKATTM